MSVLSELSFKKPDEAAKIEAVRRILGGEKIQDIADEYRVSCIQVHGWRKAYGSDAARKATEARLKVLREELLEEQDAPKPIEEKSEELVKVTKSRHTLEEKKFAVEQWLDGQSYVAIAEVFEVHPNTIYAWVSKYEHEVRRSKRKPIIAPKEEDVAVPPEPVQEKITEPVIEERKIEMMTTQEVMTSKVYSDEMTKLKDQNTLLKTIVVDQMLEIMKLKEGKI